MVLEGCYHGPARAAGMVVFPPSCYGPAPVQIAISGSTGQTSLCLSPKAPEYQP